MVTPKSKEEFEKQIEQMKLMRSSTERLYRRFLYDKGKDALKEGQGKGQEPKPWCVCHSRNPCPITVEIERFEKDGPRR